MQDHEGVFALNAMVTKIFVGDSMSYTSCSIGSCKKKVTLDNSFYFCARCNQTMKKCVYRYILKAKFIGIGGNFVATMFDDVGTKLINISAE
jgi:predicted PP-loop superfamily ATPase